MIARDAIGSILLLLFAAEGVRRLVVGIRLLVGRRAVSGEELGFIGGGRLEGRKLAALGIFYVLVGVVMVGLVVAVRLKRGHW